MRYNVVKMMDQPPLLYLSHEGGTGINSRDAPTLTADKTGCHLRGWIDVQVGLAVVPTGYQNFNNVSFYRPQVNMPIIYARKPCL